MNTPNWGVFSSPVAGTSNDNSLQKEKTPALSRNLSRQEVSQALSEVAASLLKLASALVGESSAFPASPLSLPPLRRNGSDDWPATVGELVNEFLRAKARAGRSDRYLRALKNSLSKFNMGRAHLPLHDVTVRDVEKWLERSQWSARTRRGYLSDVRVMFSFAVKRGYLSRNPAAAVEVPDVKEPPPRIHTPEQVKTVLEFARSYDADICRSLAVRYFCGLRSAEIERLEESEIRQNHVEVTAAKSKTRRRRLVTIQPNLRQWLALGGKLPLRDVNNRMRWFTAALRKAHGIEWPHNVTRHSFVSYHLAHFGSAARTALEAGHTEQMTFAHYRELVTPEAGAAFWSIVPG